MSWKKISDCTNQATRRLFSYYRSGRVISNEVSLQYYEIMAMHDEDAWKWSNLDPQYWINAVRELAISANVALRLPVEDFRTYFARHFIQHKV